MSPGMEAGHHQRNTRSYFISGASNSHIRGTGRLYEALLRRGGVVDAIEQDPRLESRPPSPKIGVTRSSNL